jgi:hypothetical protein
MKAILFLMFVVLTSTLNVTAQTPQPPAQAVAAGFTHLVFDDEFTTDTTIALSKTDPKSGYSWYRHGDVEPNDISVNTGAGSGATAGATGVLTIDNTPDVFNAVLQSVPGDATGLQRVGTWQHGYFEARIQYSPTVTGHGGRKTGWPSFWLWAIQALSPVQGQKTAECDIFEALPLGTAGASSQAINTLHNWENSKDYAARSNLFNTGSNNLQVSLLSSTESAQPTDGTWHTYGCLWTSNANGSGSVQFYYDGFLVVHQKGVTTFLTGENQSLASGQISGSTMGTSLTAMENDNLFIYLGTAQGWPMNVDWVRVWQEPAGSTPQTVQSSVHFGRAD